MAKHNVPAQEPATVEPEPGHGPVPVPVPVPVDASGRPMLFQYPDGAFTELTGHKACVPGGPGTGTPEDKPSRCYGCNAAWRTNSVPVVAADGYVWHNVCAMPKWKGPGLPAVAVTRVAPTVSNPARAAQDAELAAMREQMAQMARMVEQLTSALAGKAGAPVPAQEPATDAA